MEIIQKVDFEFSGCDYHTSPPKGVSFDLDAAKAFLAEAGMINSTSYQQNLFRDLFMAIGRNIANEMNEIEPKVRADVKARRGFEEVPKEILEVV